MIHSLQIARSLHSDAQAHLIMSVRQQKINHIQPDVGKNPSDPEIAGPAHSRAAGSAGRMNLPRAAASGIILLRKQALFP
jgi:hypothetical protein